MTLLPLWLSGAAALPTFIACADVAWLDAQRLQEMIVLDSSDVVVACMAPDRLEVALSGRPRRETIDVSTMSTVHRLRAVALIAEDMLRETARQAPTADQDIVERKDFPWRLGGAGAFWSFIDSASTLLGGELSLTYVGPDLTPLIVKARATAGTALRGAALGVVEYSLAGISVGPGLRFDASPWSLEVSVPLTAAWVWAGATSTQTDVITLGASEPWLGAGLSAHVSLLVTQRLAVDVGAEGGWSVGGLELRVDDERAARIAGPYGRALVGLSLAL